MYRHEQVTATNMQSVLLPHVWSKGNYSLPTENFNPQQVAEAVKEIGGAVETEASGGINLDTITAYAAAGVDYVSVGGLIHQARSLDLSLKAVLAKSL
jgi:nicotinate-nucleotide pyrophosphorylase (carboxylating)